MKTQDKKLLNFAYLKSAKIAGLCGIFGPIICFVFISVAIFSAPWFDWNENYISDLGGLDGERPIYSARGTESILLNIGLIISGIMEIIFAFAVRKIKFLKTPLGRKGSKLLIIDMIAFTFVGIFPETTGLPHLITAGIFFLIIPFMLLIIGYEFRKSSKKKLGNFIIFLGIFSFCLLSLLLVPRPIGNNAIAEVIQAVIFSIFSIVFGYKMFKNEFFSI